MSSEACYSTFVQHVMENVCILEELLVGITLQDVIVASNFREKLSEFAGASKQGVECRLVQEA